MASFWTIGHAKQKTPLGAGRRQLHDIIFEADTSAGKTFDLVLILSICLSVIAVMLDSVEEYSRDYGFLLDSIEWFFTILFTVEYGLRLSCVGRPLLYAVSFFGFVDLLAILPSYLSFLVPGTEYLLVIRLLRVLRIFRVLKLTQYIGEADHLIRAMRASRRKITVFIFAVFTLVVIFGALMHMIEGPESGFDSIPQSVYWAIVTLTTVGYGDLRPFTPLGKSLAACIMIMGYGIIAVPTGIVTAELTLAGGRKNNTRACHTCGGEDHDDDAHFCKHCGEAM